MQIKEWYTPLEVAQLWQCSRQYVAKIIEKLEGIKEAGNARNGKKHLIPRQALFYGKHKDLVLWGEPYKKGGEWWIKKYTANGVMCYEIGTTPYTESGMLTWDYEH